MSLFSLNYDTLNGVIKMDLVPLGEKTYYIPNVTNIGVYKLSEEEVCLIDTGNDKDAGKKILKCLEEHHLKVKMIINTHSHADHIGGNEVIVNRTEANVLSYGIEKTFIYHPMLEPAFLYGSYPFSDLQNKFLCAKPTNAIDLEENLPEGLSYFSLKGHTFDMVGIKTSDDVYFLGDSLISEKTIFKYHFFYLYNVKEYLHTLDFLSTLKGKWFVPSHHEAVQDIMQLIEINREGIFNICDCICEICKTKHSLEQLQKEVFEKYSLQMNLNQYYLVQSVLKAYLSYLIGENKITYCLEENQMFWITKECL